MRRILQFLIVLLVPIAVFAAMIAADRLFGAPGKGHKYVVRLAMPPVAGEVGLPPVEGPPDASRPLIVIDPGHGGHDPGAGSGAIKEKMLTLALARALRDELLRGGGIRVALTRDDDRYLLLPGALGDRPAAEGRSRSCRSMPTARRKPAMPAVRRSIRCRKADRAIRRSAWPSAKTVPIRSMASRWTARAIRVSAILVDLSQRETQAASEAFARMILREARGKLRCAMCRCNRRPSSC